ncbi:hypothetical protein [Mycolicibacterium sp. CBMA 361]|uniref:ATP-binding protein n=1 Tax=Mycolicibacterium sp. CBMA 361 TaxID=2606610 RepID=UPI0031B9D8C4
MLDDLLGIADEMVPSPLIDPDARHRRLTALLAAVMQARTTPALCIIEDAHWIDTVSESMLADLLTVIPHTQILVLITARPDYAGALAARPSAQTIKLAPLDDSQSAMLLGALLGTHPSVGALAATIAGRAAGNPFFADEMVRELVQRGVLSGERGRYVCPEDVTEVAVPATIEATIEARIDRLTATAKRTLYAASVIGARFDAQLLAALSPHTTVDELMDADLIDQVRLAPRAEYAFHHPLIRAVAYDSQLRADRTELHRRVARAIETAGAEPDHQQVALIAEHLESAGELHQAYAWHMRAGAWSAKRDVGAARVSWERASLLADRLPDDSNDLLAMRIAPRTMLCATDFRGGGALGGRGRFAELRELCARAGDKRSLLIGMTGQATEVLYGGHPVDAALLVSEQMTLLDSVGDPNSTMGLAFVALATWFEVGAFDQILRWSQTVIELAAGEPDKGTGFGISSPLAVALAFRGLARWWSGRPGWRRDLDDAVAMAIDSDQVTHVLVLAWAYGLPIAYGVLRPGDSAVLAMDQAVETARQAGNDFGLAGAEFGLRVTLLHRDDAADRQRGLELMGQTLEWLRAGNPSLIPVVEVATGPERARRGERDVAIAVMRTAVDSMHRAGRLGFGIFGTGQFVETLLDRGTADDLTEAQVLIDRLTGLPEDWAMVRLMVHRLRALQARARGDDPAYRALLRSYGALAESLGFEGHSYWAQLMLRDDR